ncbi:N-acyl homoserine lactonase family protein [Cryptosporangium aurantiacum]|uniref:Glyoxylase, beta-lactamase superfamily II n=1 Tax=Cryptosporangium aurantiacum TaxID=134849 RepID=A0A1M7Q155_9ACTN|nr:N-acyl homoserine lactonase family protein [Cryptosporangium aurantiacum]SHN23855.1 Glyoxylase, beta-lactamase superfamily II [Cryptosporangium aurantiacum]
MSALVRGPSGDRYAVYALQYGRRAGVRGEHFLGWDATAAEPHPTAYYAWLALSADRTILVDSGIDPDADLPLSGWEFRTSVPALLSSVGIDGVDTLVLTHLHYDHAGGVRSFPDARVVVTAAELEYWTGPAAARITREAWLVDKADLDDVAARAELVEGDREIAPGLSVHPVGGHTAGMQIVRVNTDAGPVVLASDSSHFYENLDTDRPGTILHTMAGVYTAFDRARWLADGGVIVPGHDPEVRNRFPSVAEHIVRIA